jgi:hypothetical protein
MGIWESAVSTAAAWVLDVRGVLSSIPGKVKNFLCAFQTSSGTHPESYPVSAAKLFLGLKRSGRDSDLTSNYCQFQEYVDLYTHSPTRLRDFFTSLFICNLY